ITAKAKASGESECLFSNQVTVSSGCSSPPTISCITRKGAQGSGPTGAAVGTSIKMYYLSSSGMSVAFTVATVAGNTWLFDCTGGSAGCSGGANCLNDGTYFATATEAGKCESDASSLVNVNCVGSSTAPVISTSPIYNYTTSVSGTSSTATGEVYL